MLGAIIKCAVAGCVAGFFAGMLAGGACAAWFGQPFSGRTGAAAFFSGMVFPGLLILSPGAAGAGVVGGALLAWVWGGPKSND